MTGLHRDPWMIAANLPNGAATEQQAEHQKRHEEDTEACTSREIREEIRGRLHLAVTDLGKI